MLLGLRHVTTPSAERFIQEFAGSALVGLGHAFSPPVETPAASTIAPDGLKNCVCLAAQVKAAEVLICKPSNGVVTGSLGLLSLLGRPPRGHGQVKHLFQRDAFRCAGEVMFQTWCQPISQLTELTAFGYHE